MYVRCVQGQDKPQAVEPALQKLRSFLHQIDEDPNVDLDGPIKRLRQVSNNRYAPACTLLWQRALWVFHVRAWELRRNSSS